MAYPTMETSVPTLSTTQVEGPYVEFFWIYAFILEYRLDLYMLDSIAIFIVFNGLSFIAEISYTRRHFWEA